MRKQASCVCTSRHHAFAQANIHHLRKQISTACDSKHPASAQADIHLHPRQAQTLNLPIQI